jgi:hypothetical protein
MVHTGRSQVRLVGSHLLSLREPLPEGGRSPTSASLGRGPGIVVWDNPLQSTAPHFADVRGGARTRWPHPAPPLRC